MPDSKLSPWPWVLLTGLLPALRAQDVPDARDAQTPPAGHSMHGEEFNEGPRQAAYLMRGTGNVHFPIATDHPETQAFFDQGVGQLHGFWYFEAERSFRQVAALEPDCAMAYWGMAMANVNNAERAATLAAQAMLRREQADPRGRRYIDALAVYYEVRDPDIEGLRSKDPDARRAARRALEARTRKRDEKKLARELVRGFEAIVHERPDDIEAKAFLANQLWLNTRRGLEYQSHAAVDALLELVFRANPDHPAHHYRIHLWDYEAPERALGSAAVSGQCSPAVAHQWHMSGHIFARLDRHEDAAWQQEASARVDHARMMRDRVMPYQIFNYGHNNEWLCRSLMHVGRVREALDLARNMIELPRHPERNRVTRRGSIAGYGRQRLFDVLETYQMWEELAAACESFWLEPTDEPREQARRLRALGIARFRLGDSQAGGRCIADLEGHIAARRRERHEAVDTAEAAALERGESEKQVTEAMEKALKDASRGIRNLEAMRDELEAWSLLTAGDDQAAGEAFDGLRRLDETARAEVALLLGDTKDAVGHAGKAVARAGGEVPPLVLLILALHADGQVVKAGERFAELRGLAGRADLDTPLLRRLVPVAKELGLPEDWRLPRAVPDDVGARPDLAALGPFRWSPVVAPEFRLPKAGGGEVALSDYRGRPVLVIQYLGFGCLHCVEQLEEFEPRARDFAAAGIEIVAIGTDPLPAVEESLATFAPEDRFPFPLLADPDHESFRRYRAYDDFEDMPLHGTYLIDGQGLLRWQDISYEPFREVDFLLAEAQRLLEIPAAAGGTR